VQSEAAAAADEDVRQTRSRVQPFALRTRTLTVEPSSE
jgi:hypothetical protein